MRRISKCGHRHTGEIAAGEVRRGDAVCIDGRAGIVATDPTYRGARLVIYLDGVEDVTAAPDDVLATVGPDVISAIYAAEDDYLADQW